MVGNPYGRVLFFPPGTICSSGFCPFPFSFHTLRHGVFGSKPRFRHSFRFLQAWEKRMRLEYYGDYAIVKEQRGKF
jgi:hypothetical protein